MRLFSFILGVMAILGSAWRPHHRYTSLPPDPSNTYGPDGPGYRPDGPRGYDRIPRNMGQQIAASLMKTDVEGLGLTPEQKENWRNTLDEIKRDLLNLKGGTLSSASSSTVMQELQKVVDAIDQMQKTPAEQQMWDEFKAKVDQLKQSGVLNVANSDQMMYKLQTLQSLEAQEAIPAFKKIASDLVAGSSHPLTVSQNRDMAAKLEALRATIDNYIHGHSLGSSHEDIIQSLVDQISLMVPHMSPAERLMLTAALRQALAESEGITLDDVMAMVSQLVAGSSHPLTVSQNRDMAAQFEALRDEAALNAVDARLSTLNTYMGMFQDMLNRFRGDTPVTAESSQDLATVDALFRDANDLSERLRAALAMVEKEFADQTRQADIVQEILNIIGDPNALSVFMLSHSNFVRHTPAELAKQLSHGFHPFRGTMDGTLSSAQYLRESLDHPVLRSKAQLKQWVTNPSRETMIDIEAKLWQIISKIQNAPDVTQALSDALTKQEDLAEFLVVASTYQNIASDLVDAIESGDAAAIEAAITALIGRVEMVSTSLATSSITLEEVASDSANWPVDLNAATQYIIDILTSTGFLNDVEQIHVKLGEMKSRNSLKTQVAPGSLNVFTHVPSTQSENQASLSDDISGHVKKLGFAGILKLCMALGLIFASVYFVVQVADTILNPRLREYQKVQKEEFGLYDDLHETATNEI